MRVIDVGSGPPLVLVPGVQGRWEWMRPAVEALARQFRVVSYSLAGEPSSGYPVPTPLTFDTFVAQLDRVFADARLERATVVGVSYGGLVALRYAAERPSHVGALVLASTPAPEFKDDARVRFYSRAPRLLLPVFVVGSTRRAAAEVRAAFPEFGRRVGFGLRQAGRIAGAPMSPRLMRDRMRCLHGVDLVDSAHRVRVPTLVVTGEPALDKVVPVGESRHLVDRIPGAEYAVLPRTGHLGCVTRPEAFADLVTTFARRVDRAPAELAQRAG